MSDPSLTSDSTADTGEPGPEPGPQPGPGPDEAVFVRRYLAHAGTQLPAHPPARLDRLARDHLREGTTRADGEILVEVGDLDDETSVVRIVTADAPYLVDSVSTELRVTGHPVLHLLHPQLVVRRDPQGRLVEVLDLDDTVEVPDTASTESWMLVEIDSVPAAEREEIAEDVRRVITDVHLAVDDGPEIYRGVRALADTLAADPGSFDREVSTEAGELLRWLADGNFMFLGHAAFSANELAVNRVGADPDALGVLRGQVRISPPELLPAFRSGAPVVVFKSPLLSSVLRSARYDCVTVVEPRSSGAEVLHVYLGLFSDVGDGDGLRVPVVRKRIAEVIARSGVRLKSYSGRRLIAALRTLPRDELLEADADSLLKVATLVVNRAERGGIGVFSRIHLNGDFASVLVYLPAARLGPETIQQVRAVVAGQWPGSLIGRDDAISDLGLARLHFLVALRPGEPIPTPDYRAVESRITALTRRWADDLADLLLVAAGEVDGHRLMRRYERAFPEAYKEDFSADTAVRDIRRLETLPDESGLAFDLYVPPAGDPANRRLKILRTGAHLSLARMLPMLSHLGLEVVDERPYEIDRADGAPAWVYDFGLSVPDTIDLDERRVEAMLEALRQLWRGEVEQDGFNALVLTAGLSWRQVAVLRAYAKYLRQAGTPFSQGYIEQTLRDHPGIAAGLVQMFEARFDPDVVRTDAELEQRGTAVREALGEVPSLDQDRILRSFCELVEATTRTNYYQRQQDESGRQSLAFKLDPHAISGLPDPRPKFEIWVYSPRVEGVHLRFGPVARGGLRWSDRREDFRTEVLGLVKAQTVKNAVIVPVGAKGGFVAKQLPDPSVDREAWLAEGIACYRSFIDGMLDLTDNYVGTGAEQRVEPPARTRRYDGDDPYLVVAADKGTATFSDIANSLAVDRGFWLGDAFASGGSAGYDHKDMGITARGAWESVKYHFRERGVDIQSEPVTVVGVGDMSGDVFGNGMLLSRQLKLVAAFDHRHVFLDPEPDPETSWAERQRLFAMPRSSWADYDRSLISSGGGVYPRTLKSIPVSPAVARTLGLAETVQALPPAELLHAILVAPVDLLWNGGIGTYVKASTETDAQVGDKANDALRANGSDLRCRVVGEGGNLGLTQLGRIEFARHGGAINTDAIDNSAGVDTSDHEVNIKILLDRAVTAGELPGGERTPLLISVTDEVGTDVLRDNIEQNILLGVERRLAVPMAPVHQRFMRDLERRGELDRALEFLPSDAEMDERETANEGLCSPELAVLTAYAKITLTRQLHQSDLPEDPWFRRAISGYFPDTISARFDAGLDSHPLGADIITTCVVNDLVNRAGITFAYRVTEESGADPGQAARAYTVAREVFDLESFWRDIEALDHDVPTEAQDKVHFELRRLIDRATRWLIDVRYPISDLQAEIARYAPVVRELSPRVPHLLRGAERETLHGEVDRLVGVGVPRELATRAAILLSAFLLLDVVEIAQVTDRPADEVADLHFALSERYSVDRMLTAVTELPRDDRWSALARAALRHDVYGALSAITSAVLRSTDPQQLATQRIAEWEEANAERVARTRSTLDEALQREPVDLATLSVALRVMRGLPA